MDITRENASTETACSTRKRISKEDVEEIKERLRLEENIQDIWHKILVMSGKGGVGKSSIEYLCDNCGRQFEISQSMNDKPLSVCAECKGSVRRLISGGDRIYYKGGISGCIHPDTLRQDPNMLWKRYSL